MPFDGTRPVKDPIALANLPSVTMDGIIESEPWGPSSKVSLAVNIDGTERLGARITNDPRRSHAT